MNLKISGRLILIFGVMSLILVATIAIIIFEVSQIFKLSHRVVELRAPTANASVAMSELAIGNLETEVPAQDQMDEIGEMAQAVQVFKDNALKVI